MKLRAFLPAKVTGFLKKYQLAAAMLLLGVLLLSIPEKNRTEERDAAPSEPAAQQETASVARQLETLLSQVDGAGTVRVMLTVSEGERTVYQTDRSTEERISDTGQTVSNGEETVFADGSSRREAIPVQVMGPVYQGAVIVAEGGDRPQVRLDLTNAVMSLTGLGADRITVIKMKMN